MGQSFVFHSKVPFVYMGAMEVDEVIKVALLLSVTVFNPLKPNFRIAKRAVQIGTPANV